MFDRFRRDVSRYFQLDSKDGRPGLREKARILFEAHALQAIAVYRFGAWVDREVKPKPLWAPLKLIYRVLDKTTLVMWGMHINEDADIGGGLYIGHAGPLLIGSVKMGKDCNLSQNVIIGRRSDGMGAPGVPTIGDRVWIGPGSVLFGNIVVGDGATIGPLTLVGRNVGPGWLVNGNPMTVISRNHDNTQQIYGQTPGLERDSASRVPKGAAESGSGGDTPHPGSGGHTQQPGVGATAPDGT